jgi:stage II sporulation protein D
MRKNYFLILPLTVVLSLTVFIFYPRSIEHGIHVESSLTSNSFFVNGKIRVFKSKGLNFEKNSVVNFKYNLFNAYGFRKVIPIRERIMTKDDTLYELEQSGPVKLSSTSYFYISDKENTLFPSDSKSIIVGKNNVKSYVDRHGHLKTFILAPMDYSTMRVAISNTDFSSLYHNLLELRSPSPLKIFSLRENYSIDNPANSPVVIEMKDNNLHITSSISTRIFDSRVYIEGDSIYINSIQRGIPAFTPSYNGVLEFTASQDGALVINEVELEDYLSKVVPSEMPASSALEALKCQAIAARTYAISDMLGNRFARRGFHVDDSTQSQVYNNIPVQSRSTEAVNLTKGLIMTYKGMPIDAKYYSSSAGTGVNYQDIWFRSDGSSEDKPYLATANYLTTKKSLPVSEEDWLQFYKDKNLQAFDSISPYFRWQVEFSQSALTNSLNKSLKSIFERRKDFMVIKQDGKIINELPELVKLQDIKILKRSEGGNLIQVSFIFENAVVDLSGDYNIRGAIRCSKDFAGTPITILRHKGSPLTNANYLPSSFFSVEKSKGNFIIYGGGYGHGVGMSQYGAMELAKSGSDYITILNTFYKDIKIEKLY